MRSHGFILALLAAILLAYLLPQGPELLPLKQITDIGIGFIFLFYGLKLSPSQFKLGFLNYKVHLVVQLTTFLVFPLLAFLFLPFFEGGTDSQLWLALFFLAALPSTVSSSIVMVSLAKGNLPTAIFNASLSGLLGIVLTPLWMSLFMDSASEMRFGEVLYKLFLQIILPLIIGLLLQKYLGELARKYNRQLGLFDKSIILLIVYSSFSSSFTSDLFDTVDLGDLLKLLGLILLLFAVVYFGLGFLCRILGFSLEDTITAKFCGTKKSLVHGSVMVKIIFGNSANTGLLLLPIMIYHIFQLLAIAVFAERYSKREENLTEDIL